MALTKTKDMRTQIAHLEICDRCIWDYAVAVALISHLKGGSKSCNRYKK